jgi:hypothetical protein
MSRYKAALIHLGISAGIGIATLLFMLAVWYPGPFFEAVGGGGLVLILLGVDVTMGPLITLVVFNKAKKSLKMDLTVVALLQLAAFIYGVSIIFEARPVYVVFAVDRFELVRAVDLDPEDLKAAKLERFRMLPVLRPQPIGVQLPTDPAEKTRALELALQGKDIHLRPEYYTPYDAQRDLVKRKLQPIKRLADLNPGASAEIDRAVQATGKKEDEIGFVPLKARNKDLAVVIDKATGDILDYWAYRPWDA